MIKCMLEEVEVEDVACTVDDMDGTDRSRTSVQREWSERRVERGHREPCRERIDWRVLGAHKAMPVIACEETITALCSLGFVSQRLS